MKTYELLGSNHKALVIIADNGDETLLSYGTPIIVRNARGELKRVYNGFTATTGRHIKEFCGLNKAGFLALPLEEV